MNRFIEFLKKLDRYFLLNHTLIWNSKLHYIIFWGLLVNIPLISFLTLYHMELYQVPIFYNSFFYVSAVISILILLYWIYKQTKYISVKEYGKFRLNGLKEYLLYFFSIAIISSTPMIIDYTITSTYQYKLSHSVWDTYTNQEIVDLTEITSEKEITFKIKEIAERNDKFFDYSDRDRFYVYFWIFFIWIFLPLLLMIYQIIKIKYFIQAIILAIMISVLAILLVESRIRIASNGNMSIILWTFVILILSQIVFRNKVRFLFLFLIDLLVSLFFIFLTEKINFISLDYNSTSYIFSFLLFSLFLIILIISFVKSYMVKHTSVPKE